MLSGKAPLPNALPLLIYMPRAVFRQPARVTPSNATNSAPSTPSAARHNRRSAHKAARVSPRSTAANSAPATVGVSSTTGPPPRPSACGTGDMTLVQSDSRKVYAVLRQGESETILVVANLSEDPVSDYHLSLGKGSLSGTLSAQMLLGEGKPAALIANAAGGFDAYAPLPTLEPKSALLIALK